MTRGRSRNSWIVGMSLSTLLLPILHSQSLVAQSDTPAAFVTNYASDSVTSFTINGDGSLNYVGMTPAGDAPQCISISADGRFLAVGHGTASTTVEELMIFEVNSNATLTFRLLTTTPDSPLDCQWVSDTVLAVTHTSLSGPNSVIMYLWDDASNTIQQIDSGFTGSFNTSLAVSTERSLLFANSSLGGNAIFSFGYDAIGMLAENDSESVSVGPVAVACSADGNFVYGAGGINGSGSEITAYSVDAAGALTPIAGAQSPGDAPKVIGINEAGTVLVAGHGADATIQSFIRDPINGTITPSGFSYDVGDRGNLGDLQVMGDIMLVSDESTFDDGVKGLLSFRINSDGSFTQLGTIVDTQGSRPEYIAAWPGPPGAAPITPTGYLVLFGVEGGGGLQELVESDNLDLSVRRDNNDVLANVWLEVKGVSPVQVPSSMKFTVESSVFARRDVEQFILLYDYQLGEFESVDVRPASRFTDQDVTLELTGDLSRFVQPGTGCVRSHILYRSDVNRQRFAANIDLISWTIQ